MTGCSCETLSLCKHGVPVKMGCLSCNEYQELLRRIEELEKERDKGIERLKGLEIKVKNLTWELLG